MHAAADACDISLQKLKIENYTLRTFQLVKKLKKLETPREKSVGNFRLKSGHLFIFRESTLLLHCIVLKYMDFILF